MNVYMKKYVYECSHEHIFMCMITFTCELGEPAGEIRHVQTQEE